MRANASAFDLLVIGAGTAGIPCAIEAAARGATVGVVEKSARIGGTLHLTGGHMSGGGTRLQARRAIDGDSPARHFDDVMRISRGTADPALVRLAVDEAPRTLDWLDALDFPWADDCPRLVYGHEPYSIARTVYAAGGTSRGGLAILGTLRPLWNEHVEAGRIVPLLNHEMVALIVEDERVVGARVQGSSGAVDLRAPNTVLATGGYASASDLFRALTNGAELISTASPTSTGEGIERARSIGASVRNGDLHVPSLGGIEIEPGSGRADWQSAWAMVFTSIYRAPREIYVNSGGQRFLNEEEPSAHARELALMEQPAGKLWAIFDHAALHAGESIVRQWSAAQIEQFADEGRFAWRADSVEALAERAGLPRDALVDTVAACNCVARGAAVDALGRTSMWPVAAPPFYALLTRATVLITFGGLHVDGDLRVLRRGIDGDVAPIVGLFAAGEALGAGATCGQSFCGGMMVTPALSFGRILGRRLGTA